MQNFLSFQRIHFHLWEYYFQEYYGTQKYFRLQPKLKKKTVDNYWFHQILLSIIGIVLYYKIIVGINFKELSTMVSIWCKTFSHLMIFVVEKSTAIKMMVGVKMSGTKNKANHSDSFKCAFALCISVYQTPCRYKK